MGSFRWLRADKLTQYANIYQNGSFKCLIPKEFGGGSIIDHYQDYGYLGHKADGSPKYDMYELLAFWNKDMIIPSNDWGYPVGKPVHTCLKYKGQFNPLKEIDEFTNSNRALGIVLGCYTKEIMALKYPLKLVSYGYKGTYEDNPNRSYGDPNQGCRMTRQYFNKMYASKYPVLK